MCAYKCAFEYTYTRVSIGYLWITIITDVFLRVFLILCNEYRFSNGKGVGKESKALQRNKNIIFNY